VEIEALHRGLKKFLDVFDIDIVIDSPISVPLENSESRKVSLSHSSRQLSFEVQLRCDFLWDLVKFRTRRGTFLRKFLDYSGALGLMQLSCSLMCTCISQAVAGGMVLEQSRLGR
jgi:hypothetical protein